MNEESPHCGLCGQLMEFHDLEFAQGLGGLQAAFVCWYPVELTTIQERSIDDNG